MQRDEATEDKAAVHFYTKLPRYIAKEHVRVLLVDPMLGTAGSSSGALKILVGKFGVAEQNILFLNVVACREGLLRLNKEFPKVRVLTCAVDSHLNDDKYLVPGLGDFGDRYYRTEQ